MYVRRTLILMYGLISRDFVVVPLEVRHIIQICMIVLSLAAGLTSCVKDIVMDAREKPQVVVVCILKNEPVQELTLHYTKGALEKERVPVAEAEAVLIDDSIRREVGHFKKQKDGLWALDYEATPGHQYRLEVSVPGYGLMTSEQRMPLPLQMLALGEAFSWPDGLRSPNVAIPSEGGWGSFVPNAEDFDFLPKGSKMYFLLDVPDPLWLCARNYDSKTGQHSTAEVICTNYPADPFNLTGELYAPPQRTDIPNPYVEGSHVSVLYPNLEGAPLHRGYLRFPARDLSKEKGWWFSVSGSMTGKYNCKDFYQFYYGDMGLAEPLMPDEGYLQVSAVSSDLDTYLVDAFHKQEIKASADLSTIYLRDNLYTNIDGGLGIFGGQLSWKFQWSDEYEYIDDGKKHYMNAGPELPLPMYLMNPGWSYWYGGSIYFSEIDLDNKTYILDSL
jgi:hypothetical protein